MGSSFRRPSRFWTSVASPFVAASLLVQVGRAEDKRSIVGVCAAASAPTTNQLISVRGLGGFSLNLNYAQNQLIAASRKQTQLTPRRPRAVTFVTGQY